VPWKFQLATDIGGRAEQQDRAAVFSDRAAGHHLAVVADGMGGHRNGAEAAQVVLDVAQRELARFPAMSSHARAFVEHLCRVAHSEIQNLEGVGKSSPGSTCVFLYCCGAEAFWAHVGDSRLYHFRQGHQVLATVDHSLHELMASLRPDDTCAEKLGTICRSQIYMCLGGREQPQPDLGSTVALGNDLFLLCSDGFWDSVKAAEVVAAVRNRGLTNRCTRDLVALARERGGKKGDNVSLLVAQWVPARFPLWLRSPVSARSAESEPSTNPV